MGPPLAHLWYQRKDVYDWRNSGVGVWEYSAGCDICALATEWGTSTATVTEFFAKHRHAGYQLQLPWPYRGITQPVVEDHGCC